MKLTIEIEKDYYELIKFSVEHGDYYRLYTIIANGKPYEETPKGDLISREALKKNIEQWFIKDEYYTNRCHTNIPKSEVFDAIDNAPTVEPEITDEDIQNAIKQGYKDGYAMARAKFERPQGKWIKIFENPFTNGYVCPFCNHKIQVTEQFLPQVTECESCGADMRGGAE